jgi:hypothetical protein
MAISPESEAELEAAVSLEKWTNPGSVGLINLMTLLDSGRYRYTSNILLPSSRSLLPQETPTSRRRRTFATVSSIWEITTSLRRITLFQFAVLSGSGKILSGKYYARALVEVRYGWWTKSSILAQGVFLSRFSMPPKSFASRRWNN